MLHTSLCTLLNIQLPIIQAPIGSATCPELVAAVSNAGGLGMLALSWRNPEECRQIIRETRRLTNRPFGINLVLEWSQVEQLKVCLEEEVKIVSFFWGNPESYIQIAHDSGAVVLHAVASASEAKQAVEAGVDVIVAQGWEAGGHVRGKVATFALVPSIVDVVSSIPVVAAGGIADGRGIAAALALGASGFWMGTRFLVSDEASVHPLYKQKIIEATEDNTVYSSLFDIGWSNAPHRTLRNSTISNWEGAGNPPMSKRPNEGEIIAYFADGRQIERYSDVIPLPGMSGDVEPLRFTPGRAQGLFLVFSRQERLCSNSPMKPPTSWQNALRLCSYRTAAQQVIGCEGETAPFLSRCPLNLNLRGGGFALRHLSRWAFRGKNKRFSNHDGKSFLISG